MASTSTKAVEKAEAVEKDNRVEVFIPRGTANEDPNFYVSVNGLTALLPRGKKSMVLPEIAAEIERAREAQEEMDNHIDELLEAAK